MMTDYYYLFIYISFFTRAPDYSVFVTFIPLQLKNSKAMTLDPSLHILSVSLWGLWGEDDPALIVMWLQAVLRRIEKFSWNLK